MTKRIDPRSPKKKAKDAAYAKLPAAIICKPLQFIGANTPSTVVIDPVMGIPTRVPSPEFRRARHAANRGDGAFVQAMALSVSKA